MYEGGVRVPMIVRWPGVVAAGSTCDRVTGFEDWLPTFAELCAAEAPSSCDGISFVATLRGGAQPARDFLYREFAGYGGWQAVWQGKLKLVRSRLQKGPAVTELFDLDADVGETTNLAAKQVTHLTDLETIMQREHVASPVFRLQTLDGDAK